MDSLPASSSGSRSKQSSKSSLQFSENEEWKGRGVRERKGSNIKSNNALINPQSRLMFSERVIGALNGALNEAFPLLNPFASMRAPQDEDNDTALDRSSLVTCGWDPGKDDAQRDWPVSLTARLSLRAPPTMPTGAPSSTISLSQAGSAGMDCRRRRPQLWTLDFGVGISW